MMKKGVENHMKLDQAGIAPATVFIVLTAVAFGTTAPPVIADIVDIQPDNPFYFLERVGEQMKKTFSDERTMNLSLADERLSEFIHMVDKGKPGEYSWLIEEWDRHLSEAISLSSDNKELFRTSQAIAKIVMVLEDVKHRVPEQIRTDIRESQLWNFSKMRVIENVTQNFSVKVTDVNLDELERRIEDSEAKIRKIQKVPEFEIVAENLEPTEVNIRVENITDAITIENTYIENLKPLQVKNISIENYRLVENENVVLVENENVCKISFIVLPENKWLWTNENSYLTGEPVTIYFMNRGEECLENPVWALYLWNIERYEDGEWKNVGFYPPENVYRLMIFIGLRPGEVASYTWDQIEYEGTFENYRSKFAETGKYRVVWNAGMYNEREKLRFTHEFGIVPLELSENTGIENAVEIEID